MRKLLWAFTLVVLPLVVHAELPDFRSIVKESTPAVVKILVESKAEAPRSPEELEQLPEYLQRFFQFRGEQPRRQRQRRNTGSGFVVSADGYIVTNNHVVEGATSVTVRFTDRREYDAEIVGLDPRSDLALLKIEESNLPTLQLASDDSTDVGEWVLAIGSPFGLDFSVTAGIVSAKGRSLPTENGENYVPFLQTDVAINPGNSGGPLFNLDGNVVGVNSQIFTRSGGSIGLSFAIPSVVVRNVIDQLKANGEVVRGWLGVSIQEVDRNLAESFGLDRPRAIETTSDLPHVVGLITPGTTVDAIIVRDGKERVLNVKVGGLDADQQLSVAGNAKAKGSGNKLGLVIEDADTEMMADLGLTGGVLVLEVAPDSAAAESGIVGGDVITRLGKSAIQDASDLAEAIDRLSPGQSVAVRLIRQGAPFFLAIRVPEVE